MKGGRREGTEGCERGYCVDAVWSPTLDNAALCGTVLYVSYCTIPLYCQYSTVPYVTFEQVTLLYYTCQSNVTVEV